MAVAKRVVLHFPRSLVDKAILSRMVREFDLDFNILKASVTPKEEGLMVVELSGAKTAYEKAVKYLKETGVKVQPLSRDVVRNDTKCTHCGACVVLCPTNALVVEPKTRMVQFNHNKCIACGICVLSCPPRAMEIKF